MADERDSLLREVDEELRREQMQKVWERYNGLILGGAALVVAGVAGYKFLEHRRIANAEAAGAEYDAALRLEDDKKADEAAAAFSKIAQSGPAGYAALARLHVAGSQVKAGKNADAAASYDALAKDSGADPLLRNFAQLQAASLRAGEADFTEMQNRLNPLLKDQGAYRKTAQELLGLAAFKAGKLDEARKNLEPLLIDPESSRAVQERIKVVMAKIAEAETGNVPAAPAAAAPAPAAAAPAAAPAPAASAPAAPAPEAPKN